VHSEREPSLFARLYHRVDHLHASLEGCSAAHLTRRPRTHHVERLIDETPEVTAPLRLVRPGAARRDEEHRQRLRKLLDALDAPRRRSKSWLPGHTDTVAPW